MTDHRVSDEQVTRDLEHATHHKLHVSDTFLMLVGYPADLRDARAEIERLQKALSLADPRLIASAPITPLPNEAKGGDATWENTKSKTPPQSHAPDCGGDESDAAFVDRINLYYTLVENDGTPSLLDEERDRLISLARIGARAAVAAVEPHAWVIGGTDGECDINGFIAARATPEGEFQVPLYASPPDHAEAVRVLAEVLESFVAPSIVDVGQAIRTAVDRASAALTHPAVQAVLGRHA